MTWGVVVHSNHFFGIQTLHPYDWKMCLSHGRTEWRVSHLVVYSRYGGVNGSGTVRQGDYGLQLRRHLLLRI